MYACDWREICGVQRFPTCRFFWHIWWLMITLHTRSCEQPPSGLQSRCNFTRKWIVCCRTNYCVKCFGFFVWFKVQFWSNLGKVQSVKCKVHQLLMMSPWQRRKSIEICEMSNVAYVWRNKKFLLYFLSGQKDWSENVCSVASCQLTVVADNRLQLHLIEAKLCVSGAQWKACIIYLLAMKSLFLDIH